jgi:hypothetical protein
MQRSLLIEHQALSPLMSHLQSSGAKGLVALLACDTSFVGTASEIYAGKVAERVSELDSSLESLRLALNYIMDLATGPAPSPAEYRYHYENFIFRTVGLIDRAHRFVGASLLLEPSKYECVSGNSYVMSHIKTNYPEVCAALGNIVSKVSEHKSLRNELIHSSAFSSRELGLFRAFDTLRLPTPEGSDLLGLMRAYFSLSAGDIAVLIAESESLLIVLIESLTSVYEVVRTDT